ncbi:MAG: tetratricopeptide repeat protein [Candidatus Pacebacteria bacterium]|nr:tetratricopeptide repeat protein [Candidatus Paceibacterota bacterium]
MQIYINKIFSKSWQPFAIIAILGLLLYSQTLFFDWTYLDDNTLILNSEFFLNKLSNVFQSFGTDVFHALDQSASYYRPVLTISFIFDYQMGGINPLIYHFTNIILHLLSACLVFVFLKKLKYKRDVSFLWSLVFLSHPVLTQAVAWVPGRNDSLLTVFILSAFICLINFLRRSRIKYFVAHLLFFAMAIFTKETALFVLPLFIFYGYFFNSDTNNNKKKQIFIGWTLVLSLWFILRQLALGGSVFANIGEMIKSVLFNLLAIVQLVGKIIFPFNLSVLPTIQDTSFIYGISAFIFLILLFLFKKNKRWRYILFGLFWFLLFLLPSFICPNLDMMSSDFIEHRLYLPIIGFFIILIELNPIKNWRLSSIYYGFILVALGIFCFLTFTHSVNFSDRLSFWQNAAQNSPHYPLARRNLGAMHYLDGNMNLAEEEFKEALKLNPAEEMAHNNLGLIYSYQNKYEQAEKEYLKEIEINPFYGNVYYNLGLLYYKKGQIDEAEQLWKKTLGINRANLDALSGLANLYRHKKDYEKMTIYLNEISNRTLPEPR